MIYFVGVSRNTSFPPVVVLMADSVENLRLLFVRSLPPRALLETPARHAAVAGRGYAGLGDAG